MNLWSYEAMDLRFYGSLGQYINEFMNQWINGSMDQWFIGNMEQLISAMDQWINE
jgi:hypothetical protein